MEKEGGGDGKGMKEIIMEMCNDLKRGWREVGEWLGVEKEGVDDGGD